GTNGYRRLVDVKLFESVRSLGIFSVNQLCDVSVGGTDAIMGPQARPLYLVALHRRSTNTFPRQGLEWLKAAEFIAQL
ncbi:MAG: hypothetical protein ACK5PE_02155, partial [bacterium]